MSIRYSHFIDILDCSRLPLIDNARVAERFGPHRTLNTGLKYKCTGKNVKMVGKPYAVCRQSDEWEIRFKCISKGMYNINLFTGTIPKNLEYCDLQKKPKTL